MQLLGKLLQCFCFKLDAQEIVICPVVTVKFLEKHT